MGKVQILAVLTMDGCLSSELYDKAHQDLCLDRCGLDEIRKKALYRVTPDYSISIAARMEKRRHKHPLPRGSHTGHGRLYKRTAADARCG